MGASIGLTILTYSIHSSTNLPVLVLAIIGGAPLMPMVFLLRGKMFPPRFGDIAIMLLFALRFLSVLFQPWFNTGMMPSVLKEVIFGVLFYLCGRLYVYRKKQAGFSQDLLLSLMLVFALYLFSGHIESPEEYNVDRMGFLDAAPVGLSLILNILITLSVCFVGLLLSKSINIDLRADNSGLIWRGGFLSCALAAAIGAYAISLLIENGTRGALAGAAEACFLMLVLPGVAGTNAWRKLKSFVLVAVAILTGYAVLYGYVSSGALDPDNRFQMAIQAIAVATGMLNAPILDPALIERQVAMSGAVDLFLKYPLVGCGLGCTGYFVGNYPHNIILQILAENGIVGEILILSFLIESLRGAVLNMLRRPDKELVVLSAIYTAILFQNFISFGFEDSRILMFFAGACVSGISYARSPSR